LAIALLSLFVGSGGVVAYRRLSHDKKMGIAQQELTEDDAVVKRYEALIRSQTESLLEPMMERISTLESRVQSLETELATSRRKYWSAISYIRTLVNWIARHIDDVEQTQVPSPPATLAEDI